MITIVSVMSNQPLQSAIDLMIEAERWSMDGGHKQDETEL